MSDMQEIKALIAEHPLLNRVVWMLAILEGIDAIEPLPGGLLLTIQFHDEDERQQFIEIVRFIQSQRAR